MTESFQGSFGLGVMIAFVIILFIVYFANRRN